MIIPVRNGESTIGHQLAALAAQNYAGDWELIVADNGSSDETVEIIKRWSQDFSVLVTVDASSRVGINHARNAGSSIARGEFLLFCDADDTVAPGWLAAMANASTGADIVGGSLEEERLNRYPSTSWGLNLTRNGLPTALGFLPYAVGGNFGIRAAVLHEIGGWNEEYVAGGDEIDLCWRAQLKDFTLRYEPDAVVHFRHRRTVWALGHQQYRYGLGSARLYRDFQSYGIPKSNLLAGFRVWKRLLVRVPFLILSTQKRGLWIRDAAYSLGLLAGIIRYRVWPL